MVKAKKQQIRKTLISAIKNVGNGVLTRCMHQTVFDIKWQKKNQNVNKNFNFIKKKIKGYLCHFLSDDKSYIKKKLKNQCLVFQKWFWNFNFYLSKTWTLVNTLLFKYLSVLKFGV